MENIYEGCSHGEKDDIINGLESSFNGLFEQLNEKAERGQAGVIENGEKVNKPLEPSEREIGLKKDQTNSKIVQQNLELHLSFEAQQKIQDILDDVGQLTEKEKLLLYLKLPTKAGNLTEDNQTIPLSNTRQEQTQAFQWIRSNLEECENTHTLPKHEVYDDYKSHCEGLGANRTLSAPDFGKIIKCVFPKVKARRLGTRGNSKYCYSGLRKRATKETPSLPDGNGGSSKREVNNNNNTSRNDGNDLTEDQTLSAACNLVCEWANKLLGRVFNTLLDLARFLVGGSYVSTKSMAAFVVMSATESKVRKMSERLQFRSTSNSTTSSSDSKSPRSKSPFDAPASSANERPAARMQPLQASPSNQPQVQSFIIANERPQSLPRLHVSTGNQESNKLSNLLMSPPLCPPPKASTHQMVKGVGQTGNPPVLIGSNAQSRGIHVTSHAFLQTQDGGSFPIQIQKSPQQPISLPIQPQMRNKNPEPNTTRQVSRASLKRSDSCPYPSQSPRARQLAVTQSVSPISPRQPTEAILRSPIWQSSLGNQHAILLQSPENRMGSVRDLNKLLQEQQQQQQMLSPVRGTLESMATPVNRQDILQRCHSVPVPFHSPQGEAYQPLTPQLRAQVALSPLGPSNGQAFHQLKETRTKFLNNEIQSNTRRNLTQSFLTESDVNHDRKSDDETSGNNTNEMAIGERKSVINNNPVETMGNGSKCYGNGIAVRTTHSAIVNTRKSNAIDESSLNSADSLLDSPFSLNGVEVSTGCDSVSSGGNGLNDLDGLDDAETIDLLRSLNSGNNIWVNEWNNTSVQLMETN